MKILYPLAQPSLSMAEKKNLSACVDEGWVSGGRFLGEFESGMMKLCRRAFGCATTSGTTALHLTLVACGIGPGNKVLVPTLSYIAVTNSVLQCGAEPVFIDSRLTDWQINDSHVANRIMEGDIDAVIAVHTYGVACNILFLEDLCRDRGVILIEDAAEALGGSFGGRSLGSFGKASCFSFYGNKTITTGEGGMVLCDDKELNEKVKHLRSHATVKGGNYIHDRIGFNYRMSNLHAAVGCAQLERLDKFLKRKKEIYNLYDKQIFSKLKGVVSTYRLSRKDITVGYWLYSFTVVSEKLRDGLIRHLYKNGIEAKPFFKPAHTMEYVNNVGDACNYPVAQNLSERGINLPTYVSMTDKDVRFISSRVIDFLTNSV